MFYISTLTTLAPGKHKKYIYRIPVYTGIRTVTINPRPRLDFGTDGIPAHAMGSETRHRDRGSRPEDPSPQGSQAPVTAAAAGPRGMPRIRPQEDKIVLCLLSVCLFSLQVCRTWPVRTSWTSLVSMFAKRTYKNAAEPYVFRTASHIVLKAPDLEIQISMTHYGDFSGSQLRYCSLRAASSFFNSKTLCKSNPPTQQEADKSRMEDETKDEIFLLGHTIYHTMNSFYWLYWRYTVTADLIAITREFFSLTI